jgi:hypothetical protein
MKFHTYKFPGFFYQWGLMKSFPDALASLGKEALLIYGDTSRIHTFLESFDFALKCASKMGWNHIFRDDSRSARVMACPGRDGETFKYGFAWADGLEGIPGEDCLVSYIMAPHALDYLDDSCCYEYELINSNDFKEDLPRSFVYFILAKVLNRIKIGLSDNPKQRLRQLATGAPCSLELLKIIPGDLVLERRLHRQFAHIRHSGEWFEATDELRSWIESHGDR